MAWINGTYYRSHRREQKVRKKSYGRGVEAHLAAAEDAARQERRRQDRLHRQAVRQAWDAACEPLEHLDRYLRVLQAAVLLCGNCYEHKRQWRRSRHGRQAG